MREKQERNNFTEREREEQSAGETWREIKREERSQMVADVSLTKGIKS